MASLSNGRVYVLMRNMLPTADVVWLSFEVDTRQRLHNIYSFYVKAYIDVSRPTLWQTLRDCYLLQDISIYATLS
jgi:hypothetical protein